MKRLKSTSQDLREMFTHSIAACHIAEPLASFDVQASVAEVLAFMDRRDYDVVGVRRDGLVVGYVERASLSGVDISQACKPFVEGDVVEDTTPLLDVVSLMQRCPRLFVRAFGRVAGIVTRGDLQKAPVRMWLFGLVSLTEMQLLRLVREAHPDDSWKDLLTPERIRKAEQLLEARKAQNAHVDLADCLQFCDKRDILLKTPGLLAKTCLPNRRETESFLKSLERLRNDLAHAQDIVTGRWPDVVALAQQAESWLRACEDLTVQFDHRL